MFGTQLSPAQMIANQLTPYIKNQLHTLAVQQGWTQMQLNAVKNVITQLIQNEVGNLAAQFPNGINEVQIEQIVNNLIQAGINAVQQQAITTQPTNMGFNPTPQLQVSSFNQVPQLSQSTLTMPNINTQPSVQPETIPQITEPETHQSSNNTHIINTSEGSIPFPEKVSAWTNGGACLKFDFFDPETNAIDAKSSFYDVILNPEIAFTSMKEAIVTLHEYILPFNFSKPWFFRYRFYQYLEVPIEKEQFQQEFEKLCRIVRKGSCGDYIAEFIKEWNKSSMGFASVFEKIILHTFNKLSGRFLVTSKNIDEYFTVNNMKDLFDLIYSHKEIDRNDELFSYPVFGPRSLEVLDIIVRRLFSNPHCRAVDIVNRFFDYKNYNIIDGVPIKLFMRDFFNTLQNKSKKEALEILHNLKENNDTLIKVPRDIILTNVSDNLNMYQELEKGEPIPYEKLTELKTEDNLLDKDYILPNNIEITCHLDIMHMMIQGLLTDIDIFLITPDHDLALRWGVGYTLDNRPFANKVIEEDPYI